MKTDQILFHFTKLEIYYKEHYFEQLFPLNITILIFKLFIKFFMIYTMYL